MPHCLFSLMQGFERLHAGSAGGCRCVPYNFAMPLLVTECVNPEDAEYMVSKLAKTLQDADPLPACPWMELSDNGAKLEVYDFPTTMMTLVGGVLRRSITIPYVEIEGLTLPEWKVLSVLEPGVIMSFAEIEALSSTDKALVSRTLRRLEERGLVMIRDRGNVGRKKLTSMITGKGTESVNRVLDTARQKQAELLRMLGDEERKALYRALQIWHKAYTGAYTPRANSHDRPE